MGAHGAHMLNLWVWGGRELFCDKKYACGRTENGPSFSRTTRKHVVKSLGAFGAHMLNLWVLGDWELICEYQKHVVKSICLREPQKMVKKIISNGK